MNNLPIKKYHMGILLEELSKITYIQEALVCVNLDTPVCAVNTSICTCIGSIEPLSSLCNLTIAKPPG